MKSTPLTNIHREMGAKMADFAGFEMPISYTSLKEEHFAVRQAAGIFDVSHMGEFIVRGAGATDLVQHVTSNDVERLKPGQAQYSCMPREAGGIVDDLLVYRLPNSPSMEIPAGEAAYMLVVNAGNIQKDWDWIQQHNHYGAEMIDISDKTALLAVQGPKTSEILQSLTEIDLAAIPYYYFVRGTFAGLENVIISATGYTGAGGFELYFASEHAVAVWNKVMEAGKDAGLLPAGLGARDTLRLEKAFCLYGNDINDATSPLEAGLGWITKLDTTDFVGKTWLQDQKRNGIARRLVGFTIEGRRVPRNGYRILDMDGQQIGEVTSGTHSPSLDYPIGLGYVDVAYRKVGTPIQIDLGRKTLAATVVKTPFL